MVKADLITGFLGSGKTTFIRQYVKYLLKKGERICILENDYGAINVDMMLLKDLQNENLGIEMVAGGCDYDCHRRRFKTKLITISMLGYDRVLIEPSGIFDVDEFFDILHEDPVDERYEIGNVITIVNSGEDDFSEEADYLLASQVAPAGCVILSHTDEVEEEKIETSIEHMNKALEKIRCNRHFSLDKNVIAGNLLELKEEDFARIEEGGYREPSFEKKFSMDENGFRSLFFMNLHMDGKALLENIEKVFKDPDVGKIHRIKGFTCEDGKWIEINANVNGMKTEPIPDGQEILIVIGEGLKEEALDRYFPAKYSTTHVFEAR